MNAGGQPPGGQPGGAAAAPPPHAAPGQQQNGATTTPNGLQAAAQQQQQAAAQGGAVTALLEFRSARVEATYQHYMCKIQAAADVCVIAVNLVAAGVAYAKRFVVADGGGPPSTHALCVVSGSQALALLLLLLACPATYARHRGAIAACSRMFRLVVWLLYLREPYPPRLFRCVRAALGAGSVCMGGGGNVAWHVRTGCLWSALP
jgi:hypothetical protein